MYRCTGNVTYDAVIQQKSNEKFRELGSVDLNKTAGGQNGWSLYLKIRNF